MNARYQIRLINNETGERCRTMWFYTNRKKAEEWCEKWGACGKQFGADVIDTKKEREEKRSKTMGL